MRKSSTSGLQRRKRRKTMSRRKRRRATRKRRKGRRRARQAGEPRAAGEEAGRQPWMAAQLAAGSTQRSDADLLRDAAAALSRAAEAADQGAVFDQQELWEACRPAFDLRPRAAPTSQGAGLHAFEPGPSSIDLTGPAIFFFEQTPYQQEQQLCQELRAHFHRLLDEKEARTALEACQWDVGRAFRRVRTRLAAALGVALSLDARQRDMDLHRLFREQRGTAAQQQQDAETAVGRLAGAAAAAARQGQHGQAAQFRAQQQQVERKAAADQEHLLWSIFAQVNRASFGFQAVDLHCLREPEARQVVKDIIACHTAQGRAWYSGGNFLVVFVTGVGNGSGPAGARLRPALQAELRAAGLHWETIFEATCVLFPAPSSVT
ncbi:hypothetical protein ABPG75_012589 [Micractinium tetrahymenae]